MIEIEVKLRYPPFNKTDKGKSMIKMTASQLVQSITENRGITLSTVEQLLVNAKLQYTLDKVGDVSSLETALTLMALSTDAKVKATESGNTSLFVSTLKNDAQESIDTYKTIVDEPTNTPLTTNTTAVNGTAENFTYAIDSSSGEVVSGVDTDIILSGFTIGEDSITFTDVATGTVTTSNFVDNVVVSGSILSHQTDIIFEENSAGDAYALTLTGVVDDTLSTVDMSVA